MKQLSITKHLARHAFTLIEMLVVIAIIGILAAILTPALRAAFEKAKKSRAQSEISSIRTAIQGYINDYTKLPHQDAQGGGDYTTADNNSPVIDILTAHTSASQYNPRKIVYLENTSTNRFFSDPWGTQYRILLDNNYDGKLTYLGREYSTAVIVISAGPDKVFDPPKDVDNETTLR